MLRMPKWFGLDSLARDGALRPDEVEALRRIAAGVQAHPWVTPGYAERALWLAGLLDEGDEDEVADAPT